MDVSPSPMSGSVSRRRSTSACSSPADFLEALPRGTLHPCVYKGRQHGVVAGDAQVLEVVERASHFLGGQTSRGHQLVCGDTLVWIGLYEGLYDCQQLAAVRIRDACLLRAWLVASSIELTRSDDGNTCTLFSSRVSSNNLFQPGHCRSESIVVGGGVSLERLVFIFAQDFAGGGNHLAVQPLLPVQVSQRPQTP